MKIKPILFNTEMVKAILDGRKTQTRRLVKYRHGEVLGVPVWSRNPSRYEDGSSKFWFDVENTIQKKKYPDNPARYSTVVSINPLCYTDDILYVRETWNHGYIETSDAEGSHESWFEVSSVSSEGYLGALSSFFYRADDEDWYSSVGMWWKPSIHMPKEAARIFLKVTDVRRERLQDISEDEALLEGVRYTDFGEYTPSWKMSLDGGQSFHNAKPVHYPGYHVKDVTSPDQCYPTARSAFANLWNSTLDNSSKEKHGFEANPLVWVYEFERCEKPEEFLK